MIDIIAPFLYYSDYLKIDKTRFVDIRLKYLNL